MKQLTIWTLAILVGGGTCFLLAGEARTLPNWPYEKLFRESDLVVIAKAVSTKDAGEDRRLGERSSWPGVNTELETKMVLKGRKELKKFKVFHWRLPKEASVKNGPLFVYFRHKPLEFEMTFPKPGKITDTIQGIFGIPEYLLFLKPLKDGRYEPVTGQENARLSVRELTCPFISAWNIGEDY